MALQFTLSRISGFVYSFAKLMLFFATFSLHAQWSQLGNKLTGTGSINPASQGQSVSISADGKTMVLGGYQDNSNQGAIWVYTFNGSGFVQFGNKLVGTGNLGAAQQGGATGISADGKTIIVGGYHDNGNIGATWIYTFNGTGFVQLGNKLTALDATGEAWQGYSVSIATDGKTAIVGGPNDNSSMGATWVYTFNGTSFIQTQGKLIGLGNTGPSGQGSSVSIASDATTLITGGFKDNSNVGAAWIFTFNGSNFFQVGNKLSGNDNDGISSQGYSVDISSDGKTAVVGGPYDSSYNGSLWVYTFNGVSFIQLGNKLGGYSNAEKGVSVSISSDGKTIVAGGPIGNAVWVYVFSGSNFTQSGGTLSGFSPTGSFSAQGTSVDVSSDGKTILIGGPADNAFDGAAWVFTNNTIPCQTPTILGISNDINTCVGTSATLIVEAKGSGLLLYRWYRNNLFLTSQYSPNYSFSPLSTSDIGNYTCVVTNNCGSTTTIGVNVFASPNVIGTVLPGSVCSGNTMTITGSGAPNLTITGGINLNESFTALSSENYMLTGIDAMGCSNSIMINTTVNSTPILKISGNTEICAGLPLSLKASGANTYSWSNGSVTSAISISPTSSIDLSITGFNTNTCSITSLINITVNSLPDASLDLSSINNTCDTLRSVMLTGGNPAGGSYWYSGTSISQFDISTPGNYEIVYKYKGNSPCTNSISAILTSRNCTLTGICERPNPPCNCPGVKCFKIYTSFTPNGDNINDNWVIDTLPTENLIIIFDTWGNEVFRAQPYLNNWNGTQNGKNLPQGIYYYFVQTGPEKKKYTGTVSIIR